MVLLGVKRVTSLDGPQPALPVNILRLGLVFHQVVPFPVQAVARIPRLRPDQRADLARLYQLRALQVTAGGAALRPNLEDLARALYFVIDLKRLAQVPRQRLFAIDVLARVERIDRS